MSLISHKKNHAAPNVSPKSHVKNAFYMRKPNMKSSRKKKELKKKGIRTWRTGAKAHHKYYYNFTKAKEKKCIKGCKVQNIFNPTQHFALYCTFGFIMAFFCCCCFWFYNVNKVLVYNDIFLVSFCPNSSCADPFFSTLISQECMWK